MIDPSIYQNLDDAKTSLRSLLNARDRVTSGFYSNSYEREKALTDFLAEDGRFMEQIDRNYNAVDNAITELFRLSQLVAELENRVIKLVEERNDLQWN